MTHSHLTLLRAAEEGLLAPDAPDFPSILASLLDVREHLRGPQYEQAWKQLLQPEDWKALWSRKAAGSHPALRGSPEDVLETVRGSIIEENFTYSACQSVRLCRFLQFIL